MNLIVTFFTADVYEDYIVDCGPQAVSLFLRLAERTNEEVTLTESLLALEGCIELIISASTAGTTSLTSAATSSALKPSENAQEFVVNVS